MKTKTKKFYQREKVGNNNIYRGTCTESHALKCVTAQNSFCGATDWHCAKTVGNDYIKPAQTKSIKSQVHLKTDRTGEGGQ